MLQEIDREAIVELVKFLDASITTGYLPTEQISTIKQLLAFYIKIKHGGKEAYEL